MFKDKVYEELDDISRLIEPYQYKLNEELSQFPDETEIEPEVFLKLYNTSWNSWDTLSASSIVYDIARKLKLQSIMNESYEVSKSFFEFHVRDLEEGEQVTVDLENGTLSHKIFLVKTKLGYEDNELEKIVERALIRNIQISLHSNSTVNKSRLNEVADLYGATEVRSDRSYRGKVRKFCNHLKHLVEEKKLDIRDVNLAEKFSRWVVMYVKDGNLPALNNITRIKIMMHEDRPIYSIEERETK